jgi:hypothetical protein
MLSQMEIASILIFLLTVVSLYALVVSRKNFIVMVVLIPLALCASLYTGYTIYALQGTPIDRELPEEQKIEIVFVEPAKPWIYLLLRVNGATEAVYYKIDYTENNLEQVKKALEAQQKGKDPTQQGTFKRRRNMNDSESTEYMFMENPNNPLPPKPRDEMQQYLPNPSSFFRQ